MANESSLVAPLWSHAERADAEATASAALAEQIARNTGLRASPHQYAGWLGVECASVAAAVWMMRAVVVSNVLARREGTVLFVPVNPVRDPNGAHVAAVLSRIHTLAAARLRT
jgi:sirohydrochlorin cobaltochelatase